MSKRLGEFRIYRPKAVVAKGKRAIQWEVVSQLEIGEAVKMPLSARSHLITKAGEAGISIRTLRIPGKDEIEVIRIAKRD